MPSSTFVHLCGQHFHVHRFSGHERAQTEIQRPIPGRGNKYFCSSIASASEHTGSGWRESSQVLQKQLAKLKDGTDGSHMCVCSERAAKLEAVGWLMGRPSCLQRCRKSAGLESSWLRCELAIPAVHLRMEALSTSCTSIASRWPSMSTSGVCGRYAALW